MTFPANRHDLIAAHQRAQATENRIDQLMAEAPNSAELEALRESTSFKWNKETNVAHFNGDITRHSVDSARIMLASMKDADTIKIFANSPGGVANAGAALFNLFRNSPQNIEMNVIGQASSAASLMLQGADVRNVATGGTVGVHRAWSMNVGDADSMTDTAAMLSRMDENMMDVYAERVPGDKLEALRSAMVKETFLTGKEAVALGLADKAVSSKARPFLDGDEKVKADATDHDEIQASTPEEPVAAVKTEVQAKTEEEPELYSLAELGLYRGG